MNFNDHSNLKGSHALLSASQYSWIRYDEEGLLRKLDTYQAAQRGTELHEFAEHAILLGQKLGGPSSALKNHVNDAIGYKMTPEVILYYSPYAFGTTDAICFRKNKLRIHDLKTGTSKASMDQLFIYAALFCLEYNMKPGDIEMECRIYQSDQIAICEPTAEDIAPIMSTIVYFTELIEDTLS